MLLFSSTRTGTMATSLDCRLDLCAVQIDRVSGAAGAIPRKKCGLLATTTSNAISSSDGAFVTDLVAKSGNESRPRKPPRWSTSLSRCRRAAARQWRIIANMHLGCSCQRSHCRLWQLGQLGASRGSCSRLVRCIGVFRRGCTVVSRQTHRGSHMR